MLIQMLDAVYSSENRPNPEIRKWKLPLDAL